MNQPNTISQKQAKKADKAANPPATPSANMIAAVEAAAKRRGESAPEGYQTDFAASKAYLARGDGNAKAAGDNVAERFAEAQKYIDAHGVNIQHFRPTLILPFQHLVNQFGGMTVAYRIEGNYLQIATAVCSDKDNFYAKLGTALAVERLANNHFIQVPLQGQSAHQIVEGMFRDQFDEIEQSATFNPMEDFLAHFGAAGFAAPRPRVIVLRVRKADTAPPFNAAALAAQVIPVNSGDPDNEFYGASGRALLAAVLQKLDDEGQRTAEKVQYLIEAAPEAELAAFLVGTSAASQADSSNLLGISRSIVARYMAAFEGPVGAAAAAEPEGLSAGLPKFLTGAQGLAELMRGAIASSPEQLLAKMRSTPQGQAAAGFIDALFKRPGN